MYNLAVFCKYKVLSRFYKEKEWKGFWFQQIGNGILKYIVWINSNKWGSHFCFVQSPIKARGTELDCTCATLPEKTIHKQPLLLRRIFTLEVIQAPSIH